MTLDELKTHLVYQPLTGNFIRQKASRTVKVGDVAGTIVRGSKTNKPYIRVGVAGKYFYAHRLAFFYMMGRWPAVDIDHDNQDSLDNRWENLHERSHAENGRNQKKYKTNSSGTTGVIRRPSGNWRARIFARGKHINLGTYPTYESAQLARHHAEKEHDFHENHGK